jgi:esterase/lipase
MNLKKFFYRAFSEKPVIVMIHGFSERRWIPLQHAIDFFRSRGYVVLVPTLYDHTNIEDSIAINWIEKARASVVEALLIKEDVILVGFSMGGVIASQVASELTVTGLVLLAPAFEYITFKAVKNKITSYVIKKQEPLPNSGKFVPLPDHFTDTFQEVVAMCKHSIAKVTCPLILIHGTVDGTIPIRSSEYAYEHATTKDKKFFKLENVGHNILENEEYALDALSIIESNIKK